MKMIVDLGDMDDDAVDAIVRDTERRLGPVTRLQMPDLHPMSYRLFVSDDRCTLVRIWRMADGSEKMEAARRETPAHTWGPPVNLSEEEVL